MLTGEGDGKQELRDVSERVNDYNVEGNFGDRLDRRHQGRKWPDKDGTVVAAK